MSSPLHDGASSNDSRFSTALTYVTHALFNSLSTGALFRSVMADLLDAVVDIHDKLHMDVLFNAPRESISSSITVQSKS